MNPPRVSSGLKREQFVKFSNNILEKKDAGSCLFDHGEMLPDSRERIQNMTFQNSVLIFLGFVLMCHIFRWSNYSFPNNWFLFGNNVQNTKNCCMCLICKALEETDFHLIFMFLN